MTEHASTKEGKSHIKAKHKFMVFLQLAPKLILAQENELRLTV